MPPIAALAHTQQAQASRAIFDDIEREFQLNDDRLFSITQQLIDDFRLGLREYNHSMAMMYAETRPGQSKTR